MKILSIDKIDEGKFITRYDLTYETVDKKLKVYEMISRNKNITSFEELTNTKTDAVVLIMHNPAGDKILLNREYRMATGQFVYNFPAGLIDPGEKFEESAKRELFEETGLTLLSIEDVLHDSYSAVGFSNEKNICVIGTADGEFAPSTSTFEEIEAGWYTKEEILDLLSKYPFAARTQAYCYMWAK